jgi:hypothetical protein
MVPGVWETPSKFLTILRSRIPQQTIYLDSAHRDLQNSTNINYQYSPVKNGQKDVKFSLEKNRKSLF